MPDAVRAAVEGLRSWVLLTRIEIALVIPVVGGVPGKPAVVAVGARRWVDVTPMDVLWAVLRAPAAGFVLVHTHTTDAPPGSADFAVTRRLVAAGVTVGVPMLGHFVLTPRRTYDCFDLAATGRSAA